MIVTAMTPDEILKEIHTDYKTVVRKASYLAKKIRRFSIKSRNKNIEKTYDYVSPRKNNWVIYINLCSAGTFVLVAVHYIDQNGFNGILAHEDIKNWSQLSSHFLERYNERFLNQGYNSKLNILKRFIKTNFVSALIDFPDYQKYPNSFFSVVGDGVVLGCRQQHGEFVIYTYNTFITSEMIFNNQKKTFNESRQQIIDHWESNFQNFKGEHLGDMFRKMSA